MKTISIFDTTLRDGEQSEGIAFTVKDKVKIAHLLDDFGVNYIEGGWPGSNPKAVEFFKAMEKETLQKAKLTAFGSTCHAERSCAEDPNMQALIKAKTPVVCIFGKSWDFHVTTALRISLNKNLEIVRDSIQYLKKKNKEVIFDAEHFFDGYKANPEYALKVVKTAEEAGADIICLCDTNGGSLPSEIGEIVASVKAKINTVIGIHAHNDADTAVANSLSAVQNGALHVQGTINGIGERCGNANLCSIIPALQLKLGFTCFTLHKLAQLTRLSLHIAEIANQAPNDHQPYVGNSAFAHKGGIHVSAVTRNSSTYEHIDPSSVGNKQRVLISEQSGISNILYKAQELGISIDGKDPKSRKLLESIKEKEHFGYQYEEAEASFRMLIERAKPDYKPQFTVNGYRVINDQHPGESALKIEATVHLTIDNQNIHVAADGNGPVGALDAALRKALVDRFPVLRKVHLTDYKVRVLDSKDGTSAKVRVLIESSDGEHVYGTVGVSENVIEASWLALIDSLEYQLL